MIWKYKSIFIFGLSLFIAALVWTQMGMYLSYSLFGIPISVNLFQFCVSLFKEDSFYYFLMLILLNTIIAYTILITLIKIIEQYTLSRRFRGKIISLTNPSLTGALNDAFKDQNLNIVVIDDEQSQAFTMGFRKPMIVLSTGLLEMLDQHELEAVVYHEMYHQKNYDTLKTFVLQLIASAMWYIPLTKWSYQNYKIMSELSADQYAIHRMGSELGLGSALLKLIKNCFNNSSSPVLAYFADGSVNYRLKQLVEPQHTIPVRLETTSIIISIQVLLLLMSMIVVAVT